MVRQVRPRWFLAALERLCWSNAWTLGRDGRAPALKRTAALDSWAQLGSLELRFEGAAASQVNTGDQEPDRQVRAGCSTWWQRCFHLSTGWHVEIAGTVAPDQVLVTFSSSDLTTLGWVTNKGTIATQYGSATITIPAKSTFYNPGAIQAVHGNTLIFAGPYRKCRYRSCRRGWRYLRARCEICLINRGTIAVTGTVSRRGARSRCHGVRIRQRPGAITNEGSFKVVNGTFVEGAGTEVGAPIHVKEDGGSRRTAATLWPFIRATGTAWPARPRTTPNRWRRTPPLCTFRPAPKPLPPLPSQRRRHLPRRRQLCPVHVAVGQ